jgi:hypothetical protein
MILAGCWVGLWNPAQVGLKVRIIIIVMLFFRYLDMQGGNWSALGSLAKAVPVKKPTMNLNFSTMSDEEIKTTIIHQFGHALGLGHALIKPDDWKVLRFYLNMGTLKARSCVDDSKVEWTGKGLEADVVNYDEKSVMHW